MSHVCGPSCTPCDGRTFTCREVVQATPEGSTISVLHLTEDAKAGLSIGLQRVSPLPVARVHGHGRASRWLLLDNAFDCGLIAGLAVGVMCQLLIELARFLA